MTDAAIAPLLADLDQAGITLWTEEGRLRFRGPKGAMTEERRAAIAQIKPALIRYLEVQKTSGRTEFPLSPSQSRFLMIESLVDVGATHTVGGAAWLRGPLDQAALARAWRATVDAHPALRTRFDRAGGHLRQVVYPSGAADLTILGPLTAGQALAEARALISARIDPFAGDCVAGTLWRIDDDAAVLGVALHHAISDGWSVGLLLRDLAAAYRQAAGGASPALPPRPGYAKVVAAQDSAEATKARDWWRDRLEGWPDVLDLPTDKPRPAVQSFSGDVVREDMEPGIAQAIRALAKDLRISTFSLLAGVFGAVLARMAGAERVVLGIGVSGRDRAGQENVIGPFVNTLPLPVGCDWAQPARDHLTAIGTQVRDCLAHQSVPFNTIVEDMGLARDVSRPPLVQALLTEQIPHPAPDFGVLELEPVEAATRSARMDLYLSVEWRGDGGVTLDLEYCDAIFAERRAASLLACVTGTLRRVTAEPVLSLTEALMPLENTAASLPGAPLPVNASQRLAERFRESLCRSPDATAVIAASADGVTEGPLYLTYAELTERAEALSGRLRAAGIAEGDLVAVDVRRSADSIVATLAVVLSGAAYLPLDAEHPDPRWPEMLERVGVRLVLRHAATSCRAGDVGPPTLWIDRPDSVAPRPGRSDPVWQNLPRGDHAAYVMFTSGSTGAPKAVAVGQQAVLRLVDGVSPAAAPEGAAIAPNVMLAASSPGFDAATLEIWVPLLTGATIALAAPDLGAPETLADFMAGSGVDTAWFTAGLFHALVDAIPDGLAQLETVIAGGDRLSAPHVARLLQAMQARGNMRGRVLNGYGPTETTTFATLHAMRPGEAVPAAIPLGRPIGGTEIRLLDDALRPVPQGALAEIVIGGGGVAAGYLGQTDMTAERFVTLPDAPGRFYRSGDLGRIAEDGTLRHLGRRDAQVKLRGFRIELAEVEAALADHPGVAEAIAVVRERGNTKQLLTYFVPSGAPVAEDVLRSALEMRLPDYMMPARIVQLDELPVGRTGKVDRARLPTPVEVDRPDSAAPAGKAETLLAEVWAETLGLDVAGIGRNSDFFGLGGDSILAMQVAHALSARGWGLSLVDLLRHQELAAVAARMSRRTAAREGVPDGSGPVEWSPIQHYLLGRGDNLRHSFAQAFWMVAAPDYSAAQLQKALQEVAAHHAIMGLRLARNEMVLTEDRGIFVQAFDPDTDPDDMARDVLDSLDLRHGPVFAAGIVPRQNGGHEIFLAAHHAVIDIAAWRFLLGALARDLCGGPDTPQERPGWRGYLHDLAALANRRAEDANTLPGPSDAAPPPETLARDMRCASGHLSEKRTHRLLALVRQVPGARMEDVLVAGVSAVLAGRIGEAARRIDLERHGRDLPQVSAVGLVGWCTVFCPIQLDAVPNPSRRAVAAAAGARKAMALDGKLWLAWQSSADPVARARAMAVPPAWAVVNLQRVDGADAIRGDIEGPLRPFDRSPPATEAPAFLRAHPVEIGARLEQGTLHIDAACNPAVAEADDFVTDLVAWLDRLAETAAQPGKPVADVRVFPQAPLSQMALDRVLDGWTKLPPPVVVEDVLPLAPQQLGMMLETLDARDPLQHLEQLRLRFDRPLDATRLQTAWRRTVAAHPVLRSALVEAAGTWAQFVVRDPGGGLRITPDDLSTAAASDLRPFAARTAGLWRITLAEDGHGLCLTAHHAILDGWSLACVLADLQASYADPAYRPAFDPGMAPYLDWLTRRDADVSRAFWSDWTDGLPAWKRLKGRLTGDQESRATLVQTLPAPLTDRLAAVARSERISLAALYQTALAATLMAAEDRMETSFYVTDAGRPEALPDLAAAAGLFIVTLPMAFAAADTPTAAARTAARRLRAAVDNWPMPPLPRPVSETLMVFENYPRTATQAAPDAPQVVDHSGTGARTRFAMTCLVVPGTGAERNQSREDWRLELVIDRARVSRGQGAAVLRGLNAALVALAEGGPRWPNLLDVARIALGADRPGYVAPVALDPAGLSPAQAAMADIWTEVLGHANFSLDDRLDAAGGDSLSLALLHAAIVKRIGRDPGLAALAARPTLRDHAELIRRAKTADAPPRQPVALATLRDGPGPELVILPGAAGDPSAYRSLLGQLPGDWRVLAASYDSPGCPDALAPALKEDLGAATRRPMLLGHSYGAALGASLAACMPGAFAGLCVLDQPLPVDVPDPDSLSDAALAAEIARAAASYNGCPVALDGHGPPDAQLTRALAAAGLVPPDAGAGIGRLVIDRYSAAMTGLSNWQPPRLDLPLLVIRAADSEATHAVPAPDLGWAAYSSQAPACTTVAGGHISVLRPPAVASLAKALARFVHERYTTA